MTPPLRNRLRVTEHMDAKVDIEIADHPQRKRRRAHPQRGRHIRGRRTPDKRSFSIATRTFCAPRRRVFCVAGKTPTGLSVRRFGPRQRCIARVIAPSAYPSPALPVIAAAVTDTQQGVFAGALSVARAWHSTRTDRGERWDRVDD